MSINTNFYKGATKDQIRNVLNPFQYLIRVDDLAPTPIIEAERISVIETHFAEYPQGLEQGPVGVNTVEEPVRKTGTHQK
jgi:hypothetical protein